MTESPATCFSCKLDFAKNVDAFVEHMTDVHADDGIQCAICAQLFTSGADYSMHFIYRHMDQLRSEREKDTSDCPKSRDHMSSGPSSSSASDFSQSSQNTCPVCNEAFFLGDLNSHVNSHFEGDDKQRVQSEADFLLAKKLEHEEVLAAKNSEEKAFKELQEKYGMDEHGSYRQQGMSAYEKAYNKGKLTLSQLYDEKSRIAINQVAGVEEPTYAIKDLIDNIKELSRRCVDVLDSYFCTAVEFYASNAADVGFGCGYRNLQMLISSLKQHEVYRRALFGSGPVHTPSIPKLQQLIENAWTKGFDSVGRDQLNGKLSNTRKWIGATEASCLFASFKIKTTVVDFWQPSGPDNTHPAMLKWIYDYFKERRPFTPPLYFQHEGHSRTVIGVERTRSGRLNLIIFDPSISRFKIQRLAKSTDMNDIKMLRRTAQDLRHKQFQIVCVRDVMTSEEEYELYKTTMDVVKIPTPVT